MPIYQRPPVRTSHDPVASVQRRKVPWWTVPPAPAAPLDPEAVERAARFGHRLPFARTGPASGEEREDRPDVPRTLPSPVRQKMERAFGEDLSDVKIQEGSRARGLDPVAFTRGRSIHLAPGTFRPHSEAGQRLLAHEIAHVVQQRRGLVRATHRHGELPLNADPALESQADQAGDRAVRGQPAFVRGAPVRPAAPAAGAPVAQGFLGLGYLAGAISSAYDWGRQKVQDYRRFWALYGNLQGTDPELADRFSHIGTMDEAEWMADLAGRDPDLADPRGPNVARPDNAQLGFDPELHIQLPPNAAVNTPKLDALAHGGLPKVHYDAVSSTLHTGYNANQLNELDRGILTEIYGEAPGPVRLAHGTQMGAIEGAFGNPEAGRKRQQERFDLLHESYERTNEFDYDAFDEQFSRKELKRLGQVARKQNPANYLLNTRGYEGFTIGEGHGDSASKGYLIQNMGGLSQAGVNTLYLEHIRSEYQDVVDQYLTSPAHAPMPPELQRMIASSDTEHGLDNHPHGHNLMGVLTAAKQNNMRVRSIDTMAAQSDVQGPDAADLRAITMNVFGENAVNQDENARAGGKYVMLAGQAHNNTHARHNNVPQGFQQGLPGFSQFLNIPAVTVDPNNGRLILDRENKGNRA